MKQFSIDMLVDEAMTRLFRLAEYVLAKTAGVQPSVECGLAAEEPCAPAAPASALPQQPEITPTIRFKHEDKMVEGELFG